MKKSAALDLWLGDIERQQLARDASRIFSETWRAGPVHRRFEQAFAPDRMLDAQAAATTVEALFGDDAWVASLIDGLAQELRREPFFAPPFPNFSSDVHRGLAVFGNAFVSVAAGVTHATQLAAKKHGPRGATSIGFTGRPMVLKFVKAGDARISLWEADPITEDFAAEPGQSCRRAGERVLSDGDILVIDGRCQSYVIEHARSNMVILQAEILAGTAPLSVEYDSATLAYVGCSATDDGASRIQMMTTLLRKLGHDEAFDAVAVFLDHPDFFVRWHVMRELLGIDAGRALPLLRRMTADDPHPDARHAAISVLPRLEAALVRQEAA